MQVESESTVRNESKSYSETLYNKEIRAQTRPTETEGNTKEDREKTAKSIVMKSSMTPSTKRTKRKKSQSSGEQAEECRGGSMEKEHEEKRKGKAAKNDNGRKDWVEGRVRGRSEQAR